MLRPRIIPCLLMHGSGLAKTVRFGSPAYVGDPLNAVRIFNEKQVDELMVLDIDATVQGREPRMELIERMAAECRMPLCYGGGVQRVDQIERLVSLGVEKVSVSAALITHPRLLPEAARRVGSQSVAAVLDVRATGSGREVFIHNGRTATGLNPVELAKRAAGDGAGEIVLNAIDRDGTMEGYDLDLAEQVRAAVTTPVTVLGGAGSLGHIAALVRRFGQIGAAAGSLFVFKGARRAVLINYPRPEQRDLLVAGASVSPGAR